MTKEFTSEWYRDYLGKQNKSKNGNSKVEGSGVGACSSSKECEDVGKTKRKDAILNDGTKDKGKNGCDYPKFKVSVTFFMSDNRRRDLDGMFATILDCLVSSGRLLAGNTRGKYQSKKSK